MSEKLRRFKTKNVVRKVKKSYSIEPSLMPSPGKSADTTECCASHVWKIFFSLRDLQKNYCFKIAYFSRKSSGKKMYTYHVHFFHQTSHHALCVSVARTVHSMEHKKTSVLKGYTSSRTRF